MPKDAANRNVDSAMKDLRTMYRIGQEALERSGPRRSIYSKRIVHNVAGEHGISPSAAYDARKFAKRYTEKELEELIDMCQSAGCPLGKDHVAKLITVEDKRERKALQRRCIQEGWTTDVLQANLRKKYGKRSPGGGKVHPPKSVDDAERRITDLCRKLLSLHEAMKSADPKSNDECGLSDLRDGLRKQWARTMTQVRKLMAECDADE